MAGVSAGVTREDDMSMDQQAMSDLTAILNSLHGGDGEPGWGYGLGDGAVDVLDPDDNVIGQVRHSDEDGWWFEPRQVEGL